MKSGTRQSAALSALSALSALVCGVAATASAQPPIESIEVVGQTPLGAGIDIDRIAANVQQASADEIAGQRSLDLSEFMRRNLASVFVNDAQSNPLQPDLQYRGFVGSPLLGLPQGLAVYQDGVRLNEPFGDTVNWALVPDSAIDSVSLAPGSNPLFGLNALGGAVSIRTRDGFTSAGTTARVLGGSFGRTSLELTTGGSRDDFAYFVTGDLLEEDGWRDGSPTEAAQLFGKLSWRGNATAVDLGINLADTDLIGNGPAPIELIAQDRTSVFTRPDRTENELGLVSLRVDHDVTGAVSISGNAYLRRSDIATLNGDDSEFEECAASPGFVCELDDDAEALVLDASGNPIPARSEIEGAVVNRTATDQDGAGLGFQASLDSDLGDRSNRLIAGLVYDDSEIDFESSTELGSLDATRQALPGGVFAGESFVSLEAQTSNLGLYVSDSLSLTDVVTVTISARYNRTDVVLRDRLGTALNGQHRFSRINPAIGLTGALTDEVTLYARYSESTRAPSPVELTCADPDDPCRLPNAFLADPPLEQVVARSLEAGLRFHKAASSWHAGLFRTTNSDDILFVSAGALTNQGFFSNVGRTRREGVELNASGASATLAWFANYTFVDATFRENLVLPSPNNPAAVAGEISVRPGDRLPLTPRHLFKAGIDRSIGDRFGLGASLLAGSGFHFRGDEGNRVAGIGRHRVVNLRADYRLRERWRIFLNVDNVFDADYETFGLFGEADDVLGPAYTDSRFVSPAAPRAAWLGVELELE